MINLFKQSEKPANIRDLVKRWQALEKRVSGLEKALDELKKETLFFVQKKGLVTYDAFSGTGGKQSFSLALLDAFNNGVVISGLFKEGETKVFVKEIVKGECERTLSPEEKEAIEKSRKKI